MHRPIPITTSLNKTINNNKNNYIITPPVINHGGEENFRFFYEKIMVQDSTIQFLNKHYPSFPKDIGKNPTEYERLLKTFQFVLNEGKVDLNNPKHQHTIKESLGKFCAMIGPHGDNREGMHYYNTFAKFIRESIHNIMEQEVTNHALSEIDSANTQMATAKSGKSKKPYKQTKKPIRTEMIPEWFNESTEENRKREEIKALQESNKTDEEKLMECKNRKERFEKLGIDTTTLTNLIKELEQKLSKSTESTIEHEPLTTIPIYSDDIQIDPTLKRINDLEKFINGRKVLKRPTEDLEKELAFLRTEYKAGIDLNAI